MLQLLEVQMTERDRYNREVPPPHPSEVGIQKHSEATFSPLILTVLQEDLKVKSLGRNQGAWQWQQANSNKSIFLFSRSWAPSALRCGLYSLQKALGQRVGQAGEL